MPLTAHRRFLMREAGPTAGEVEVGDATPIVGAFSDATLFEDPWTPPYGTASAWEPATMSRASSASGRPYRGEAVPYMLGGLVGGLFGGPVGAAVGVGAVLGNRLTEDDDLLAQLEEERTQRKAQRPVYNARAALKEWAIENRVPVTADWGGTSPNQEVHAYGSVLILRSANDRIEAAQTARRIARVRPGVFFNMAPLGEGRVLVYFSEDPAGFLVQAKGREVPPAVYVGNIFGKLGAMFKGSPEQKKGRLASLEAKYKALKSGEAQPGPLTNPEGLLRRINRLRGELGMQPITDSEPAEKSEGFDESGRFFRRPLRPVARRRIFRRGLMRPFRPLRPFPLRPLVGFRRRAVFGGPPIMPVGVPLEGEPSPEGD